MSTPEGPGPGPDDVPQPQPRPRPDGRPGTEPGQGPDAAEGPDTEQPGADRAGAEGPDAEGPPDGDRPGAEGLSARDTAVLDLAGRGWSGPGPRDRAIRERLGMSPTAFFQHLNALLDDPAALRYAPGTVNRWRAARDRHGRSR